MKGISRHHRWLSAQNYRMEQKQGGFLHCGTTECRSSPGLTSSSSTPPPEWVESKAVRV